MFGFVIGVLSLVGLLKVARGGGHWHSHSRSRRRERWLLRWLFERLDTTPGQEKVVQEAIDDVRQAGRKAATDFRNTGPEIAKALRGEQLDHEILKQGFLRQDTQLDELRRALLVGLEKVHGALNPRQRAVAIDASQTAFQGDPTLLARALANLLENARKHGGGEIRLHVRNNGARMVFEVQDRGNGFAPGEEEQLFRPFYRRAGKPEDESGSLGLGLALVRRIAEAHHGLAYAKNREGGGAIVGIELPVERTQSALA